MESDESIDFVDSEVVNAYGSVVAKEEHENPCEYLNVWQSDIFSIFLFEIQKIFKRKCSNFI